MAQSPAPAIALSDAELDRLEFLLGSDDLPETVMDISMLDGFFTALLSGPNLVLPTQALPWIWDSEDGKAQPRFKGKQQAEELMALLMRYWNMLATTLSEHPDDYAPLIYMDGEGEDREAIIEEWCSGYVLGLAQDPKGWGPMLEEPSDELSLIMLYGTEEGWAQLGDQQLDDAYHRDAADALADCALAIYAYWRQAKAPPIRNAAKVGRNDACPCGSGKKYKLCHGAPAANEA